MHIKYANVKICALLGCNMLLHLQILPSLVDDGSP